MTETTASLTPAPRAARWYKQAASVVDRIIRDRHVRQDAQLRLYPWDVKEKAYAEALERTSLVAPDTERRRVKMTTYAAEAWRRAGDENRARILERIFLES